jgi:predicted nucleic acid-binding protein
MKLIVADSGPLIALACSGHLDVLKAIVAQVLIPETVYVECTANSALPGAQEIAAAVVADKLQRIPDPPLGVFANLLNVDPGEAAVLALAKAHGAAVLMDDAMGREIARAHGIALVGACGILLKAKQMGLVAEIGPVLQIWQDAIGYHLSKAFVVEVMRKAGE